MLRCGLIPVVELLQEVQGKPFQNWDLLVILCFAIMSLNLSLRIDNLDNVSMYPCQLYEIACTETAWAKFKIWFEAQGIVKIASQHLILGFANNCLSYWQYWGDSLSIQK